MTGVSHETQIYNITLESVIIMISVSEETQNHNITLESVIIMIGVLLGEMKSNEKAT